MEDEKINTLNKQQELIGVAARSDVHAQGLWHETFHFWLLKKEQDTVYLYFQLRSRSKRDFPSMFDITAAGHLLSDEKPSDGVREIEEELGFSIPFQDLSFAGIIQDEIHTPQLIDREFCHVYLYVSQETHLNIHLQKEEVAGLYRTKVQDAYRLLTGHCDRIQIEGFEVDATGERHEQMRWIGLHDVVPHEAAYFQKLFHAIDQILSQ